MNTFRFDMPKVGERALKGRTIPTGPGQGPESHPHPGGRHGGPAYSRHLVAWRYGRAPKNHDSMTQANFLTDFRHEVKALRRRVMGFRDRIRGTVDMEALVAKGLTVHGHVYLANWVLVDQVATYLITIGNGTVVSPRVQILAHDAAAKRATGYTRVAPVTIGEHVYIGTDSLIMPGVTIGDGAIIGAGSLVTSDVPAGAIAVGRPARVVGSAADFEAKRRAQLEQGPVFTLDDITTPEGRAAVRKKVQEAGHGFIP